MVPVSIFLTLQHKKQLTHDVYELEYVSENILPILPGQFLLCDTAWDPKLRRSYSVSWAEGNSVYFIIKRVPNGTGGSVAICDQEIGHRMQVWWPMGRFILQENEHPKVFIGTGTGFAPLYFMLKHEIQKAGEMLKGMSSNKVQNGGLFFLFWVRELRDVFYHEELQQWRKEGGFEYEIFCSREKIDQAQEQFQGRNFLSEKFHRGRVTDYLIHTGFEMESETSPPVKGGAEGGGFNYFHWNSFHIPYSPHLVDYAREQRQTESLAEKRMWYDILKEEKLKQYKFTRQKPLLNYIADFYCSEFGLVIEVDGDNHENQREYDEKRTNELESHGLKVLRFHNLRAMEEVPAVENEILEFIEKRKIELQKYTSLNPPFEVWITPPLDRGASRNPWQPYSPFTNPDTEFYICWSPAMVTEVRGILKNSGVPEEKVFFEQY
jgi:very-short-patch-repair endonuclease/NAD(P)H-flavin reductase